jgi:hypothetical protein
MTWNEIFKLFLSMLVSIGGAGFLILVLSNWLGKIWAKRINDEYKMKLDKEIEHYKSELEKARNDYQRFASKKFIIIEETWSAMNHIVDELKLYTPNSNQDYTSYLFEILTTMNKYSKVINKNSLYFSDEIQVLLNNYISACAGVTHFASEEWKNNTGDTDKMNKILIEIFNKASEREEVLKKIKLEFKKELSFN